MPGKKYIVELTTEERDELSDLTRKGEGSARKLTRARILLKADEGWNDEQIVAALDTAVTTVERIRKRFVEGGLEKALRDDPRPGAKRKLDGRGEAYLIALTCSDPPDEHDHWALRLLGDKLVELGVVDSISHETVRKALKKVS
jgi:transposase